MKRIVSEEVKLAKHDSKTDYSRVTDFISAEVKQMKTETAERDLLIKKMENDLSYLSMRLSAMEKLSQHTEIPIETQNEKDAFKAVIKKFRKSSSFILLIVYAFAVYVLLYIYLRASPK